MKIRKTTSIIVVLSILTIGLNAEELQGTTITLTDIKEALYGLLEDSKENRDYSEKNRDSINAILKQNVVSSKNADTENKKLSSDLDKANKSISQNAKRIQSNGDSITIINNKLQKMEESKILYKDAIEEFIEKNKDLLPRG